MSEGDRLGNMLSLVRNLKEQGFDRRQRREAVIAQVAQPSILDEPDEVEAGAVRKYFEVVEGLRVPVIFIAPHGKTPDSGELVGLMKHMFPEMAEDARKEIIDTWITARESEEGRESFKKQHPGEYEVLLAAGMAFDEQTEELTRAVLEMGEFSGLLAKRGRRHSDANRPSFEPQAAMAVNQSVAEVKIENTEEPTSVRAAMYWALRRLVEQSVGWDVNGEAQQPVLVVFVHGIADRPDSDVTIAGGRRSAILGDVELANHQVLKWFGSRLAQELVDVDLPVDEGKNADTRAPRVAIHRYGLGTGKALYFEAGKWKKGQRNGMLLAAHRVGIHHFRDGATFWVDEMGAQVEESKRDKLGVRALSMPGLGNNVQLIQLELGASLRFDDERRERVAQALVTIAGEFGQRWVNIPAEQGTWAD